MRYRDAQAIAGARDALDSIIEHAESLSLTSTDPGAQGRLAAVAAIARDQLTTTLIVANVWVGDDVAGGVLHA